MTPADELGAAASVPVGEEPSEQLLAEALTWVRVARVLAIEMCPYLDVALSSMVPVGVPGLGTAATDRRWRFYYDPVMVMRLAETERREVLVAYWLHEVGHQLRDHGSRWDQLRDPAGSHRLWNIAGDALINVDLEAMAVPLPPYSVRLAQMPDGVDASMTTEQIYARLLAHMPRDEVVPGDGQESASGQAAPDDCGSGAGGPRRPWERPIGDDGASAGGARAGTDAGDAGADGSLDPGLAELIRQETADRVRRHAKSRGAESVPPQLREWAESLGEDTVDWRRQLRATITRRLGRAAGRFDYTWSRSPRRRIKGYVAPGMAAPQPPRVAVVVDTSGSMSPEDLGQAVGEIAALARAAAPGSGAAVQVIATDLAAHGVQTVRTRADVRGLNLLGGGGTDMRAGLAAAARLSPRPDVVVIITDGYTPWPVEPPPAAARCAHIAVLVADAASQVVGYVPDWMQVIVADDLTTAHSDRRWAPGS